MKIVLSLLMTFVLLQSQSWALSGGPDFGTDNTGLTLGTFAGVMLPVSNTGTTTVGTTTTNVSSFDAGNSLGVFSIGIPQIGLASGVFVYFSSGATYTGTIVGEADPDSLQLRALIKAQFNITTVSQTASLVTGATTSGLSTTPGGFANGSLKADVSQGLLNRNSGSTSVVRISGKANLEVQSANVATGAPVGAITSLVLSVDGYKQSATTAQAVDIQALTNTQASSSTTSGSTGSSSNGG